MRSVDGESRSHDVRHRRKRSPIERSHMPSIDAIETMLDRIISDGQLASAATLVWRGGRVEHSAAVGWQDIAAGLRIRRDTLFRIASLSKPVTSVVALALLEQGRFTLDEPISRRWAPEFANMRV